MKLSDKVISEVANKEGTDPAELDPLAKRINPEALDQLFESIGTVPKQQNGIVTFRYMGYTIMVTSNGDISIE